jgi:cell division septum initiation protein DivIVA
VCGAYTVEMERTLCRECDRLQGEVQGTLSRLVELTTAQLNAFRAQDHAAFVRLDKELENTMGTKERIIGAARQHEREHKKSA